MNRHFENTTPTELHINLNGIPAPQGSKRAFTRTNKTTGKTTVSLVESAGDKVKTWRDDVRNAAIDAANKTGWTAPHGAVTVDLVFYLPRPKSHYRTGTNAGLLRNTAPTAHTTKPDRDKLERSTHDALTSAGVIHDDSNIIGGSVWKHYADGRPPGATITIRNYTRIHTED